MTVDSSPGVGQTGGSRTDAASMNDLLNAGGGAASYGAAWSPLDGNISMNFFDDGSADRGRMGNLLPSSNLVPVARANQLIYTMPQDQVNWLGRQLRINKAWTRDLTASEVQASWAPLLQNVLAYNSQMNTNLSPFQFLTMANSDVKVQEPAGGASGYSRVVDFTNPSDAQVLVNNALGTYLGREATTEESATFLSTLNKLQQQNPIVSTPSSRSGGVNRDQVAKEFGQAQEGSAEYMASTQYMDWFMENLAADPTEGLQSGLTA